MSTDVSPLFRPFACKSLQLANRVAMAPMTRMRSPNYIPNDEVVGYYRRRAEAGVGLLITEGTTVNHKAANGYEQVPAFHGAALDGGRRWSMRCMRPVVASFRSSGMSARCVAPALARTRTCPATARPA